MSLSPKRWVRKHLRHGDLDLLSSISMHVPVHLDADRIDRLYRRGFLVKKAEGSYKTTLKGRIALWVRRLT